MGGPVPGDEHIFRILLGSLAAATICLSAIRRAQARRSGTPIRRIEEGPLALTGRMLAAIPLAGTLLVLIVYPQGLRWAAIPLSSTWRWAGAAIASACVLLLASVFRHIGRNISETVLTKRDHQLVTSGPYRWVRHPLYAATLIELAALGLLSANALPIGLALVGAAVFRCAVIPAEEARLIAAFGQRYRDYQRVTGALSPRWPRRRLGGKSGGANP
jgi:protein-S-isoprenylcysteine O-methyltransferase Ste14